MTKLLQDVHIGQNIQKLRKQQRLTQTQVCAQLGILGRPMLQSTYAQIESGKRNLFVSDLIVLKEIFHTSYESFFVGLEPVNKYEGK